MSGKRRAGGGVGGGEGVVGGVGGCAATATAAATAATAAVAAGPLSIKELHHGGWREELSAVLNGAASDSIHRSPGQSQKASIQREPGGGGKKERASGRRI